MFSLFPIEQKIRELWPETLRCVFGQDTLTPIVPISIQVYKWAQANFMLGGNPVMD